MLALLGAREAGEAEWAWLAAVPESTEGIEQKQGNE